VCWLDPVVLSVRRRKVEGSKLLPYSGMRGLTWKLGTSWRVGSVPDTVFFGKLGEMRTIKSGINSNRASGGRRLFKVRYFLHLHSAAEQYSSEGVLAFSEPRDSELACLLRSLIIRSAAITHITLLILPLTRLLFLFLLLPRHRCALPERRLILSWPKKIAGKVEKLREVKATTLRRVQVALMRPGGGGGRCERRR